MSDPTGIVASPHAVMERCGDPGRDHASLAAVVRELGAELVVVGLPISLDGRMGPAAKAVAAEVEALTQVLGVAVKIHDERFTTVAADRSLIAAGKKAPARRRVVDKVAAAVLLQSWLDGQR